MIDILIPYPWRRNSKNYHPIWNSWLMFISKLCCVLNFIGWAWRIEWKLTFCLTRRHFLSAKELVQVIPRSMMNILIPYLWRRNSKNHHPIWDSWLMFISKLCCVLNSPRRAWSVELKLTFCMVSRNFLFAKGFV